MEPKDLLLAVRRRQGLTQHQLAMRAGTSQPVVSAYEHGRRDPTIGTLRRLVQAAGERVVLSAESVGHDLPPPLDAHDAAARLLDVLSLADALPSRPRPARLTAPRLVSR